MENKHWKKNNNNNNNNEKSPGRDDGAEGRAREGDSRASFQYNEKKMRNNEKQFFFGGKPCPMPLVTSFSPLLRRPCYLFFLDVLKPRNDFQRDLSNLRVFNRMMNNGKK